MGAPAARAAAARHWIDAPQVTVLTGFSRSITTGVCIRYVILADWSVLRDVEWRELIRTWVLPFRTARADID